MGEHNSGTIIIHSQQESFDGSEYHTNIQNESPHVSSPITYAFDAPQGLLKTESDRQSIQSCSSDVPNKYQTYVFVEDLERRCFKVLVQFDTGASSNFISRGTLERLGRIKVHPIAKERISEYQSPIDGNAMTPRHCVFVKMWNDKLSFLAHNAKLKIIERSDVFQIIIGRNLMGKSGGSSLLVLLEQLDDDAPNAEAAVNLVGALIKESRSASMHSPKEYHRRYSANVYDTEQRAIDAAKNKKDHQAFLERQKILASSFAGLPDLRAEWQRRRTGTSSTQSTQFTQYTHYTEYSLDRQSTTSTMSSWSETAPYTPKTGGSNAALRTEQGNAPRGM
jgi:hypothetical protein